MVWSVNVSTAYCCLVRDTLKNGLVEACFHYTIRFVQPPSTPSCSTLHHIIMFSSGDTPSEFHQKYGYVASCI